MADDTAAAEAPPEPLNLAPIAAILVIAGPVLVALSSFLEWVGRNYKDLETGGTLGFSGFEVPAKFVIDSKANVDGAGLPIAVLVLLAAAIALIGVLRTRAGVADLDHRRRRARDPDPAGLPRAAQRLHAKGQRSLRRSGLRARNTVGFGAVLCGFGGVVTLLGTALGWFAGRNSGHD